jgi:DNA repair exonuclease SbcCD ATPase subunit
MADEQVIIDIRVKSEEISEANSKINQLTSSIEELSNQTASARKQNAEFKRQQQELTAQYEQNKISSEKYVAEVDKLNVKIQANNRIIAENKIQMSSENNQRNANIKLIHSESSAYDKLNAEYQIAAKNAKNLGAQYGVTSTQAKNAAKNANDLGNQLKQIDATVGQHTRNVGNYSNAWQGFGSTLKNMFMAGGIVGLVTMALGKVKEFFTSSVDEAQQAQKSYAKVEQAIISTGGAAGYTAQQLKIIADQLEAVTNIDADTIMNDVTAQLLTFTSVQGEQFKLAQKAVLDYTTVRQGYDWSISDDW